MVEKIVRWIVRLFSRHGYIIVSADECKYFYAKADSGLTTAITRDIIGLENRISALEAWRDEQPEKPPEEPSNSNEPTFTELLNEWLNGEERPDE